MLLNLFLQQVVAEPATNKTMLDMIKEGGWTMIPLFLLSFLAIYIIIERLLAYHNITKKPEEFMEKVKKAFYDKDIKAAIAICESENSPVSRMILKGLKRLGNPLKNIEESVENVGKLEIDRLERNLTMLATVSGAAPMLGFLGTVTGMISTFNVIAQEGNASLNSMASGISEALITTVTGLIIGIIAYVAYSLLTSRLQKIIHKMEHASIEFIDLLQEPQK
jgi:biopolymer transport protein ExbB